MSLLEFFERYWLILVLSFVAIGMGVIKWSYSGQNQVTETVNTEQYRATPTDSEEDIRKKAEEFEENYPLFESLPYGGKDFVIEKYLEPLTLEIIIAKEADKGIVIKEVEEWLSDKLATDSHRLVISSE